MANDQTSQQRAAHSIPVYDGWLAAFHRAFERELTQLWSQPPLRTARRALDLACGDGFYTRRFADAVAQGAAVTACDLNLAYLGRARRELARAAHPRRASLVAASFDPLPFATGSFDFVWCAQSLQSLPDPRAALREIARVLRPGGIAAVLENDSLHQAILPWPATLEVPLRAAELAAHQAASEHPEKFYLARRLPEALEEAGLVSRGCVTHAFHRAAPLGEDERVLLQGYLDDAARRAGPHLSQPLRDELRRWIDPGSPQHLLARPRLSFTWLTALAMAEKP